MMTQQRVDLLEDVGFKWGSPKHSSKKKRKEGGTEDTHEHDDKFLTGKREAIGEEADHTGYLGKTKNTDMLKQKVSTRRSERLAPSKKKTRRDENDDSIQVNAGSAIGGRKKKRTRSLFHVRKQKSVASTTWGGSNKKPRNIASETNDTSSMNKGGTGQERG